MDAGFVQAVSAGTVTVTAARRKVEAGTQLIVAERTVTGVGLDVPLSRLETGDELGLRAEARDQRGDVLVREIRWSSSDTSVATVDQLGTVRAASEGTAEVSAIADGVSGVMTLTVVPRSVHVIELIAPAESLLEKASLALEVVVRDDRGQLLEGREIEWEVSDETVATIDVSGVLTGIAPGALTATAVCGGRTASAR